MVGCLSGLAAVGFHQSIDLVNRWLLDPLLAKPLSQRLILIPLLLIGVGLIVGILLDKVVPFARGSGIPEVKTAYAFGPGAQLSLRTVVGKFVLGALRSDRAFAGTRGPRSRSARPSRLSARRHVALSRSKASSQLALPPELQPLNTIAAITRL